MLYSTVGLILVALAGGILAELVVVCQLRRFWQKEIPIEKLSSTHQSSHPSCQRILNTGQTEPNKKFNKTKKRVIVIVSALFAVVCLAQTASAFYAPNLQRWVNRDPFGDYGFQELLPAAISRPQRFDNGNLYSFINNYVVAAVDAWGLEATFPGCKQREIDSIKKVLKDVCNKANDCAAKCPAGAGQVGVRKVCDESPKFNCMGENQKLTDGTTCKGKCAKGEVGGNNMYLCPGGFKGLPDCPSLGCVIFHESLHMGGISEHTQDFSIFDQCMGCPHK